MLQYPVELYNVAGSTVLGPTGTTLIQMSDDTFLQAASPPSQGIFDFCVTEVIITPTFATAIPQYPIEFMATLGLCSAARSQTLSQLQVMGTLPGSLDLDGAQGVAAWPIHRFDPMLLWPKDLLASREIWAYFSWQASSDAFDPGEITCRVRGLWIEGIDRLLGAIPRLAPEVATQANTIIQLG